jgi:hypothetical protein
MTDDYRVEDFPGDDPPSKANGGAATKPLIQSSAEFVADFVPPDYVLDRILQRRFAYCFTGKTGAGKTAILLLIAACVALGIAIGERAVLKGRVLYFAGENPDDVRMRWIALAQRMQFDINTIDVHFIARRCKLSEVAPLIAAEVEAIGEVTLVIIDTGPAPIRTRSRSPMLCGCAISPPYPEDLVSSPPPTRSRTRATTTSPHTAAAAFSTRWTVT